MNPASANSQDSSPNTLVPANNALASSSHPQLASVPSTGTLNHRVQASKPTHHALVHENQRLRELNRELVIQRDDAEQRSIILQRENAVLRSRLNLKAGDNILEHKPMASGILPSPETSISTWAEPNNSVSMDDMETSTQSPTSPRTMLVAPARKRVREKTHSRALFEQPASAEYTVAPDMENVIFSGSLWSYNTAAVRVIASALGLPVTGIKPELVKRVSDHLESHRSELEHNPRFVGLYTTKYRNPSGPTPKRTGDGSGAEAAYVIDPSLSYPNQRRRVDDDQSPVS